MLRLVRKPPNVLFLHAHDMGRAVSPYGFPAPTPRIQAFAETSLVFRNAHAAAPTCSPSRAALLTGQTAHQAGMLGLAHRGFRLAYPDRHLAAYLGRHGYHTVLAGIQHEIDPLRAGSLYKEILPENFIDEPAKRDRHTADSCADFLGRAGKEKPWMMWAGFFWPHRPFAPAESGGVNPDYVQPPAPLPDSPSTRQDMADYYASVAHTDRCFGIVLDALRETSHADNTVIVMTTDHGIAFPDMKCRLTGHGTGVALILNDPRNGGVHGVSDALVSHLDVFPSICDLVGVPVPDWSIGYSLTPVWNRGAKTVREDLFSEVNFHAAAEPMRAVRTERFNYIRIFDDDLRAPLSNVDEGPSKSFLLESGWSPARQKVQLYDLLQDPQETCSVADDPCYSLAREQMDRRLRHWMEVTDDPLLHDSLHVPPGAVLNTRDSLVAESGPFLADRNQPGDSA